MWVKSGNNASVNGKGSWHYWFAPGKELLQRPFDEVLKLKKPEFPFCLAWANESWYAKLWKKDAKDKLLIEQQENTISVVLPVYDAAKSNVSQEGQNILDLLKNRILSRSEIEELTGLNRSKVIRELNKLVEKNLISKSGGSRDTRYFLCGLK